MRKLCIPKRHLIMKTFTKCQGAHHDSNTGSYTRKTTTDFKMPPSLHPSTYIIIGVYEVFIRFLRSRTFKQESMLLQEQFQFLNGRVGSARGSCPRLGYTWNAKFDLKDGVYELNMLVQSSPGSLEQIHGCLFYWSGPWRGV